MNNKNIKNEVLGGMFWRFAERCGAQGIAFIVSIVLARLVEPSAYGTIALINVFIAILNVFVDSGMGNALIQKKNADDIDYSSVFYFNMFMSTILYMIMFFLAPRIARFYNNQELIPLIRVISLTLLIAGVKSIQSAYVSKNMEFKKFFFSTLGGTIGAAIIGIVLAYKGFGVWALVIQSLFNNTVDTIILWVTVKWRPKRLFSINRLRALFSYGWKLLCSALLDTGYNNLRTLIIGKLYSPVDLAHYNRGKTFPDMFVSNINSSIGSVLFPAMSQAQNERETVKLMTRKAICVASYLIWPCMAGLAAVSPTMIPVLLTDKWLPCVPYLIISCFVFGFWPIHTANLQAIKALGHSDLFLKMEIIKKVIGMVVLIIAMRYGVMAIAMTGIISTIVSTFINAYPNKELLNYSYLEQIKDILPSFLLSMVMGTIVYCLNFLKVNSLLLIIVQVILGIIIYLIGSILFHFKTYYDVKLIISKRIRS